MRPALRGPGLILVGLPFALLRAGWRFLRALSRAAR